MASPRTLPFEGRDKYDGAPEDLDEDEREIWPFQQEIVYYEKKMENVIARMRQDTTLSRFENCGAHVGDRLFEFVKDMYLMLNHAHDPRLTSFVMHTAS